MKKILLTFMIGIILISMVSAFEFDNDKERIDVERGKNLTIGNKKLPWNDHWDKYTPIRVKNAFGLGETLFEGAITKHTEVCDGYQCSSEFYVKSKEDYPVIQDIRFVDEQGNPIEIDYELYIQKGIAYDNVTEYVTECDDYYNSTLDRDIEICETVIAGYDIVERITWKPYILGEVPVSDEQFFKISSTLPNDNSVDWQIKAGGKWLNEWALWTPADGIVGYWKLDELSGNFVDSTGINADGFLSSDGAEYGDTGKVGTAIKFNGTVNSNIVIHDSSFINLNGSAMTVNAWVKSNGTDFAEHSGIVGTTQNDGWGFYIEGNKLKIGKISINEAVSDGSILEGTWQMVSVVYNGTDARFFINGTEDSVISYAQIFSTGPFEYLIGKSGTLLYMNGSIDEVGIWNRTLTENEIADLYNGGSGLTFGGVASVVLNSPNDYASYSGIESNYDITFNCSGTGGDYNITNMSLYTNESGTWTSRNETTGLNVESYTETWTRGLGEGDYLWNCMVCDANDECNFANSNYTVSYRINEFAENSQTYNANVGEGSYQNYKINISYNESKWEEINVYLKYNDTAYSASKIGTGNTVIYNKSITIQQIDVAEYNQSFYWIFNLTNATGTYTYNSSFNKQTISEIVLYFCNPDESPYINFTIKDSETPNPIINATFKSTWDVDDLNFSLEDLTETNSSFAICVSPNDTNYTFSATIEYDANEFAKNFYYITDAEYSTTTSNVTLYLLNDSLATLTEFIVRDSSQNAKPNVTIIIQKYDVGTDSYVTVGQSLTNYLGKDINYLIWYDAFYKFILVEDGSVIYTTEAYKIYETPQIFEVGSEFVYSFDKFKDFEYSLIYNNDTENFVLTYVKPSGLVDEACLQVYKQSVGNETQICNICSSSSSATLYCNIAGQGNGTYVATFYATGSIAIIDRIFETIGESFRTAIFTLLGAEDATFYAIILSAATMLLMLISPVLGVIGLLMGLLASQLLGFTNLDYTIFIIIAIFGGMVIWMIRR